jgi:HlyD family secretion protein
LREERAATGLQLRNAELGLELAQLDFQIAQRDLRRCLVRSPVDGFSDIVVAVLGEEVDTGREFTKIHKLDPIHVRIDFPQERLDDVFLGQDAEVVLDSFPQEKLLARVVRIAPQADPETRVLPVVLEMENSSLRVRAGLTGFARLYVRRKGVVVPATAIVRRGTEAMVFRMEHGQANIRKVKVGDQAAVGMTEIVSGLQVADEVVIYGTEFLRHGDAVRDDWRNWARRK